MWIADIRSFGLEEFHKCCILKSFFDIWLHIVMKQVSLAACGPNGPLLLNIYHDTVQRHKPLTAQISKYTHASGPLCKDQWKRIWWHCIPQASECWKNVLASVVRVSFLICCLMCFVMLLDPHSLRFNLDWQSPINCREQKGNSKELFHH